ncbi:hypothetical protein NP493_848g01036 [Ridgeia piscesae]|uniref:Uncharacterized protein n=1 Tax=Ridgeia piscesae TaxID=27915 RepID=A0AAD9NKM9_RIDPI|nr:hypothetical protein NP493_848g01036 [Ridgeia piscesae]
MGGEYGSKSGTNMATDEYGGEMTSPKKEYGGMMDEYGGGMSGSSRVQEAGESMMNDRIYTFAFCGESKPYHFM